MQQEFRPNFYLLFVSLCIMALLVNLGLWQLERAEQKSTRAAAYVARSGAGPVGLGDWPDAALADVQWRRVSARGHFSGGVVLLDNRTLNGRNGFEVLSPFVLVDGRVVLINRGWVPAGAKRNSVPPISTPQNVLIINGHAGPLPVTGLKFNTAADEIEVLAADVVRVQHIDLDRLGARFGLTFESFVVYLHHESPAGFERSWLAPGDGSAKHRAYAVQWFAMAAVLLIITLILLRRSYSDPRRKHGDT